MLKVNILFRTERLRRAYEKLGINSPLKKKIDKAVEGIKQNPKEYGEPISKNKIPMEYLREGFNNAYWVALGKDWRLIYSLTGINEVEIIAVVLFFGNHKEYERKFNY